ncbi:MAG TPA: TetR/AcrR family transcriptional regulator [Bryobacteraceae bacterium]|nr:TetR/AcrR family transcriptional regulator [Bryobacteraceae bacterium]
MARQEVSATKSNGRESQKNRTRKALVAAAGDLLREGRSPTVVDVAEAAGISRATAYRYFPTQDMLLAEVALFAVGGPLFPAAAQGAPVAEAVGRLVRGVGTWAYANEQPLRTLLRLSLDPSTGVRRPGHRVEWIADTLAPARDKIDSKTFSKLSRALTLLLGIDPVVVMKDIAGASQEQALDALEWTARALVDAALRARAPSSHAGHRPPAEERGRHSPTSKSV